MLAVDTHRWHARLSRRAMRGCWLSHERRRACIRCTFNAYPARPLQTPIVGFTWIVLYICIYIIQRILCCDGIFARGTFVCVCGVSAVTPNARAATMNMSHGSLFVAHQMHLHTRICIQQTSRSHLRPIYASNCVCETKYFGWSYGYLMHIQIKRFSLSNNI